MVSAGLVMIRLGIAVDAAGAQRFEVVEEMREADHLEPPRLGCNDGFGKRCRRLLVRASRESRAFAKRRCFIHSKTDRIGHFLPQS